MTQKKHPTPPQILSNDVVAKSRLFTVESLALKFSNDEQRQYERIRGGGRGAVMIVPMTSDGHLLLVREYCAGTNDYQLGFPKGLIDPGETPEQAANRELKEEVGFGAKELINAAREYGIGHLLAVANPDSQQPHNEFSDYLTTTDFRTLI